MNTEKGLNVLSLFDGMSCGRIALERAGVPVANYYASEIDKHAIKVSGANYPDIIRLGDVIKFRVPKDRKIDLLIGGSPCQGFSFAGKQLNFDDPRSALFFEFVRILKECIGYNPDVKFMLENVIMKKDYQDVISKYLGVEPILINSSLVSAQNRKRLYWTNIPGVDQPENKNLFIMDIIDDDKVYKFGRMVGRKINPETGKRDDYNKDLPTVQRIEHNKDPFKSNCLTTVNKDNILVISGYDTSYRYLSPEECERLQTVPVSYTSAAPKSQRYRMLGNGWTIDVVAHIFKGLKHKL